VENLPGIAEKPWYTPVVLKKCRKKKEVFVWS